MPRKAAGSETHMAHVEIRTNGGNVQVLVDGVDMAPHMVPEGLQVSIPGGNTDPTVTLTLRGIPTSLDLPDANLVMLAPTEMAAALRFALKKR